MFNPDTGSDNESIHDITTEFSFDVSHDLVFTSTPTKSTTIADHSICDSEASTIVFFTGPQFSPVPLMDSSSSELHTNDQSTTVVPESDSNMPVAPAPETSSIQSSEKECGLKILVTTSTRLSIPGSCGWTNKGHRYTTSMLMLHKTDLV